MNFSFSARKKYLILLGLGAVSALFLFLGNFFAEPLQKALNPPVLLTFSPPIPEELAEMQGLDPYAEVESVYLSGYFCDWNPKSPRFQMEKTGPKTWSLLFQFEPGISQYKFVVYLTEGMVWVHDIRAPELIEDNFGGFNSQIRIFEVKTFLFYFNSLLGGLLGVLIAYGLIHPLLGWVLRWKLALRFKLLIGLFFISILTNFVFMIYSGIELREIIHLGLVDQLNLIHTAALEDKVDFSLIEEPEQKLKLKRSLAGALGMAPNRVSRDEFSNTQGFISDIVFISADLKRLIARTYRAKDARLNAQMKELGFSTIDEFYIQGVLGTLLSEEAKSPSWKIRTALNPQEYFNVKDPLTWQRAKDLGFNAFLFPVRHKRELVGYYAGVVQPKMYGSELDRSLWFNVYLLILSCIATGFLLYSIGKRLTGHLQHLTLWSESILQGKYFEDMQINSGDEIQVLTENFSRMNKGLKESFSTIEDQNHRLLAEAYEDKLTKLPNRHRLFDDLSLPGPRGLILLNIDGFQKLNDFFGHEIGDKVLIEMGERFVVLAQGDAKVYKISSDEFVILYDNPTNPSALTDHAQGILSSIMNKSFQVDGHEVFISVSAGGSLSRNLDQGVTLEVGWNASHLLAEADMAMKSAKGSPRRFVLFQTGLGIKKEYGRQIIGTQMIREALKEGRILPFFQPIVDNLTGEISKYECLVRLRERDGNILTPDHFLDISKKARFYPFITKVMIFKSMLSLKKETCFFSLNLSMEDLQDADTRSAIESALASTPEIGKRMIFEIVESEQVKDYEALRDYITVLRTYGCQIAIDDFGTGYSNFEHLIQLKVDYLKIDASLIKNLDTDHNAQSVTRAIVRFAQELGIKTVAEYVHSKAIYEKVLEYGIDYSQGYYFGMPADKILPN